jgi:hypothetical protein
VSKKPAINPIKEGVIPILVAFIGIIGTFTPVLLSSLSSSPSNNPKVDIQIDDTGDETSFRVPQAIEVTLTNNGFAPATNITLIVDAPGKIANSSDYILNTTQVYPVKIEDRRLEAHIPKLVHGDGSIVKLNVSL